MHCSMALKHFPFTSHSYYPLTSLWIGFENFHSPLGSKMQQ